MNPSTVIGAVVGLLTLIIVVALSANDASMYFNLPGLAIVLGGTCAALFIAYPLQEVVRIFKLVRTVFRNDQHDQQRDIEELVSMAQLWMNADVHKVEHELKKVSNPFLRTGVQLIIDNTPEDQIIELLKWRVARLRAREQAEAQMFRVMATFAPAFGMLGTLVGLINLMGVLGDGSMQTIGQQLAIGLMTTFYGILLANLVCKPIALKLERRTARRVESMNMVLQGISMMCEKRGPAMVRETLNSFVMHVEDEIYDGGAAQPKSKAEGQVKPSATAPAAAPVSIARPAPARQ
ncbi:motility protein A [Achromobacter arsenitoxydans]|uniref:MotA/TolQ/ExbB proton channel family protein 2 n=1 Tax=Achromobacter arsenitoxydans SY8 TaxID=477184 RepID=H0FDR5_9BURK|nr:MotA/TolQ/ExbB proton channel family protein [Achromobacter arsenitoxydans]EHK63576.1 MotA/TolQ/ExbB proton channel family protein 2 [Achromobacter arsenitoxydans SY8]